MKKECVIVKKKEKTLKALLSKTTDALEMTVFNSFKAVWRQAITVL
jgi:hypothetical protein